MFEGHGLVDSKCYREANDMPLCTCSSGTDVSLAIWVEAIYVQVKRGTTKLLPQWNDLRQANQMNILLCVWPSFTIHDALDITIAK